MVTEDTIRQARAGDKLAFQTFYEDIKTDMYRTAYYLLQNREDAEDAVSEAFMDMYRGIHNLKDCGAYKAWAMKILTAKCKRKMKKHYEAVGNYAELIEDDVPCKQDNISQVNMRTDIMEAMDILSKEERMIVVCTAVAGMSSEEVGCITGFPNATVRTKLRRALAKLKKKLEVGV